MLGSVMRYVVSVFINTKTASVSVIPWGTFGVNIIGSLIIGLVVTVCVTPVLNKTGGFFSYRCMWWLYYIFGIKQRKLPVIERTAICTADVLYCDKFGIWHSRNSFWLLVGEIGFWGWSLEFKKNNQCSMFSKQCLKEAV